MLQVVIVLVTLDLTINNSTTGTDVKTACDSYTWIDGNTYTTSNNTATHLSSNAAGCDSLVTLDLTIDNSTTGTDIETACESSTLGQMAILIQLLIIQQLISNKCCRL